MQIDKLTIINRALIETGNDPLSNLLEDSDSGIAANTAFDRAIDYLSAKHQWPFAFSSAALVAATNPVPPYGSWKYQWNYPIASWHLRNVIDATTGDGQDYKLVKSGILTYASGNMIATYVERLDTSQNWHPMASEVLTLLVQGSIERGLNESFEKAEKLRAEANALLGEAAARVDQQSPPRVGYLSAVAQARSRRKV